MLPIGGGYDTEGIKDTEGTVGATVGVLLGLVPPRKKVLGVRRFCWKK